MAAFSLSFQFLLGFQIKLFLFYSCHAFQVFVLLWELQTVVRIKVKMCEEYKPVKPI